MNISKTSTGDNTPDDDNPVEDLIGQAKQGLSMIEQLLDDMEDDEFWSLPRGEWEAKNGRDSNGFSIE
jgi:hypothetical protein